MSEEAQSQLSTPPAQNPAVPNPEVMNAEQAAEIAAPSSPEPAPVVMPEVLVAPAPEPKQEPPPAPVAESYVCPDCGKASPDRKKFWGHLMGKHGKARAQQIIASLPPPPSESRDYKKKPNIPRQAAEPAEALPAPDFSDIGGSNGAPEITTAAASAVTPNYQQMSEVLFNMSTGVLCNVFGDEWKPRNDEEKTMVVMATAEYLKSKQFQDIPPGLMLAVIVTAYAAPRLRAPTTKNKLQLAWLWMKSKISRRKPILQVVK